MGSLEIPLTKGSLFGPQSSRQERHSFSQRFRSSFSRLLFKKLDYVQWICVMVVFLCLVVVFQMFLPGSVVEDSKRAVKMHSWNSSPYHNKEIDKYVLDIGEETVYLPRILEKFRRGYGGDLNLLNHTGKYFGYRKPQLELVNSPNFEQNASIGVW